MKPDPSVAAVVTGGASGLGAATARGLAAKGVKVALFDLNRELGEAVAKEIGDVYCEVNVANEESVVTGFAKARAAHGQERILVNCAGIGGGATKTAIRAGFLNACRTRNPKSTFWHVELKADLNSRGPVLSAVLLENAATKSQRIR